LHIGDFGYRGDWRQRHTEPGRWNDELHRAGAVRERKFTAKNAEVAENASPGW
jgi:hypothetical protein